MKNISNEELAILKNILIGKTSIQVKKLFNFKGQESCSNLVASDFIINQGNWNDLAEELIELYLNLGNFKTLQPIEEKVKKRNAKLGFPVKRPRILPDAVKSQIRKKETKKNCLKRKKTKNNLKQIKKKKSEDLLNSFTEIPILELAQKLEVSESTIKNVLKKRTLIKT